MAPGVSREKLLAARCTGWQRITYEYPGDTKPTIDQVRKHNAYGRKRKCWK